MEMPLNYDTLFSHKLVSFIGSVGGALLSLVFLRKPTWKISLTAIISGLFCSYFLTTFVSSLFGFEGEAAEGAIGFIIGLVSMNVLIGIMSLLQDFALHPDSILTKLLGIFKGIKKE